MSDSIEQAAGSGATLELGGKTYAIRPFSIGDYVALRNHIKSQRIAAFREASDDMEASERAAVLIQLASQTISEYDLMQEAAAPDGMVFMLWRALLKTDPELTLDGMGEILAGEDMNDLMAIAEGLNMGEEGSPKNPPETGSDGTTPSAS